MQAVEDGVASAQQKDADLTATIAQQDPTLKACLAQMDAHSLTSNDSRPSSLKDYCSSGETHFSICSCSPSNVCHALLVMQVEHLQQLLQSPGNLGSVVTELRVLQSAEA